MLNSVRMWSGNLLTLALTVFVLTPALLAQDRGIEFLEGPSFTLSDGARAAGIDGTLTVNFEVD